MPSRSQERQFIVFADMVGYSALMARDEERTHALWMDFVHECLAPAGRECGARIMRTLGDGCLLSFADGADALAWCARVRGEICADRGAHVPRWRGLSMRFAIHACPVIEEGGEIYGDGVNIAKRLQERAPADGLLLSGDVVESLPTDKRPELRYLGALSYKNIETPVPTYEQIFKDAGPGRREGEHDLPAIAVLPFRNLTQSPDLDYFAEGVIEDIIFSLSGLRELHVISRGSTSAFAGQTVDPRDVARLLSVRYVLQGSLRAAGETVRMRVSFEDALSGETIFGEICEFPHSELFAFQDNIVRKIVARVAPNVRALELEKALRKPPGNFTAYQCTLRALDLMRTLDRADFAAARAQLEKAMELDPDFVLPIAWAVRWHTINLGQNWSADREGDLAQVRALATRAVTLDRQNPLALAAYGHMKSYLERDNTTALVYFDRARQVGPSHSVVWMLSSATLSYLGKGEEAIAHAKHGLSLSPNDYELFQYYDFLCLAHLCAEKYEEAHVWAKLSRAENPGYLSNVLQTIACTAALGLEAEAAAAKEELARLQPNFSLARYRRRCPISEENFRARFLAHLEAAGVPE